MRGRDASVFGGRVALAVFGGLAVAALVIGTFIFVRSRQEADRFQLRMECAARLTSELAPAVCAKLNPGDLAFARSFARCHLARSAARTANENPDEACSLTVVPASGATP